MDISQTQIKGLIVLCLTLAIIPFFVFSYCSLVNYKVPDLADQLSDSLAIEIFERDEVKGIYFVPPETSVRQLFKSVADQEFKVEDFTLKSGMRIIINTDAKKDTIAIAEINAAKKLSLGLRLDINKLTEEELILIHGIGEVTAKKIIELRTKLGQFRALEQLMLIKGIKVKKLTKFREYLYVEKQKNEITF
jgi:competence ComEA-like helix-hairpin-helix protein